MRFFQERVILLTRDVLSRISYFDKGIFIEYMPTVAHEIGYMRIVQKILMTINVFDPAGDCGCLQSMNSTHMQRLYFQDFFHSFIHTCRVSETQYECLYQRRWCHCSFWWCRQPAVSHWMWRLQSKPSLERKMNAWFSLPVSISKFFPCRHANINLNPFKPW